jgi:hypothetical protein
MLALMLMSALGAALVLTTSSETVIAANYRNSVEALYAADAVAERALGELAAISDWDALLNGLVHSSFVDGSPDGVKATPDGGALDLTQVLALANCGKVTACSPAEVVGNATGNRPGAADNPVWRLFAYGPLNAVTPAVDSPFYGVVLIADDPPERDGDPARDGSGEGNPRAGVISLRAEAFGRRGTHKIVELMVARRQGRDGQDGQEGQEGQVGQEAESRNGTMGMVRVLSWREIR